jgi:hypothetical protein
LALKSLSFFPKITARRHLRIIPTERRRLGPSVVIASPCRFSKSRGDSLTSDNALHNALQVARTAGQVADFADFLESVSSAARFFGIFSSDNSPLVAPTTSERWCDIAIKGSQGGMNATA